MSVIKILVNVILFSLVFVSISEAKPLGETITDLFFDSDPKLEVPTDFINKKLQDGKWTRPHVGYGFQFTNHPEDKSLYLRKETLNLSLSIPIANLPLQVGPSLKAEFIRPFPKNWLGHVAKDFIVTARPYGPNRVPHNHENASRLEPGEFYSFTATMSLSLFPSSELISSINHIYGPALYGGYVVAGDFKVEVYRLSGSKVKVIASSLRAQQKTIGVKTTFVPDLQIFGIPLADNLANNILTTDLLDWQIWDKTEGNLFSVAFVYDLETPAGQEAFDTLMDPREWKKPTLKFNENVDSKLTPTERSFWMADLSKSRKFTEEKQPGILHIGHSELEYDLTSRGIKLDLLVADKTSRRHFLEIDYSHQPKAGGEVEHYRIANLAIEREHGFLINLIEAEVRRETTTVFKMNEDQEITNFQEMYFLYRREDKKLKETFFQKEVSAIKGHMRKMLPDSLWGTRLQELDDLLKPAYQNKAGVFLEFEMYLSPDSLKFAKKLSQDDINSEIDAFLENAVPLVTSKKQSERFLFGQLELFPDIDRIKNSGGDPWKAFDETKIQEIKTGLFEAFQQGSTPEELENVWNGFKNLRNNIIFRDFGVAFLSRLLVKAIKDHGNGVTLIEDLLIFQARVIAQGQNEKRIYAGFYRPDEATKELLENKERVMNRSYNVYHFEEDGINEALELLKF